MVYVNQTSKEAITREKTMLAYVIAMITGITLRPW